MSGFDLPGGVDPSNFDVLQFMQDRREEQVKAAAKFAVGQNPEAMAEAQRLAKQLGKAPDDVLRDLEGSRKIVQSEALRTMAFEQRNPRLARMLQDVKFLTMAQDDAGNLKATEDDWEWIGRSWDSARLMSERGSIGQAAMQERRGFTRREQLTLERAERINRVRAERDDGVLGSAVNLVGSMLDSAAAAAAATAVTGGTPVVSQVASGAAAFSQSFRIEAGNLYADLIEQGYTPAQAAPIATRYGAGIAAVDLVGLKAATAPFKAGAQAALGRLTSRAVSDQGRAALFRDVAKGYATSVLGESATEAVQEVVGMLAEQDAARTYQPANVRDLDWGSAGEAFTETFKGMLVVGAVGSGGNLMLDVRRAANADHNARVIKRMIEREEESKLSERSPDDRAELVGELAQGAGAPHVYVEGSKLLETLAEIEAQEAQETGRMSAGETLDQLMPGLRAEAQKAAEMGGDVKIPTGEFSVKLRKTELGQRLWADHATFDPDEAMTGAEARGFDRSKAIEEYRKASARAMEADEEVANSAREVEEIIHVALRNAKGERWTDKHGNRVDARSQAALLRDFIVTQAADLGVSPREFYNRYPLQVGAGQAQAEVGGVRTPRWAESMPEFARLQRGEMTPQQFVNAVQRRLDAEGEDADGVSSWQMLAARNPELRGKRRKASKKTLVRNMLRQAKDYAETIEVWERPEMTAEQREAFRRARARRGGPDILSYIRQAGGLTREQWAAAGVDLDSRGDILQRRGLVRGDAEGTFGNMAEALDAEGYLSSFKETGAADIGSGDFETAFLDAVNAALDGSLVVSEVDGFTPEMLDAMADEFAGRQAQDASVDDVEFGDDDVLFQFAGEKAETDNRGTFDPNNPNILHDTDQEGERRGGFRANDPNVGNRPSINLYEAADASTFLHESAHFFLHVYGDLAARGEATPRMQRDLQTLLDWFGVKDAETWGAMTLEEQRKHHEAFAASYELYLSEGKSPSSAMGRVFQKFGRWLRTIYRTIRDDLNGIHRREFGEDLPVLTDDVRRVMDRMVASEDQVAQAEAVRNMARTFEEQAESGMTDDEWASYLEDHKAARDLAVDELTRRALRGVGWLRRARERAQSQVNKEAREARKAIKADVEREVDAEPVHRARRFVRTGEMRDEQGQTVEVDREAGWQSQSTTSKLNREQARALLPEGANLNALRGLTAEEGGQSPDMVARLFGYESGKAMIEDMATAPSRSASVELRTDARMIEEQSELATPEAVEAAVEIALHNEIRGKVLAEEFKRAAEVSAPTREQIAAAKEAAREFLRSRATGDIRPRDFSLAEARARKRAADALRAGDMDAFAIEKRHELLQHHLAREAAAAREEIEKTTRQMQRVFGSDEKQAKTRDVNILRAARAVLSVFGLDVGTTLRGPMEWLQPVADYDPLTFAELEPEVQRLANVAGDLPGEAEGKWRKMTLDQFRELGEAIEAMWNKSRRSRQILLDGKRQDREAVAQRMVETLEKNGATVPEIDKPKTWLERRADWLRGYFANATRVEQLMRNLDGGTEGVFTSLFRRVKDAGNAYRAELREKVQRYETLLREHDWGPDVQIDAKAKLGKVFNNKAEVVGVLRHLGNDSNKKKALVAEGWATIRDDGSLDSSVWDDWMREQIRAGVITKADFDLVQAIWDLHEEMKPGLQQAHYRNFGYYFREVEARSFEVLIDGKVHRYRGGYVPARSSEEKGGVNALAHEINTQEQFNTAMASVPRGMTLDRNERYVERYLSYNLADGAEHLSQVLRFVHMQEAVNDVRRALQHKGVERLLTAGGTRTHLYTEVLLPWLNRAALQQTADVERNPALKMIGRIASNVNMSIMFANISNAAQNVTGLVEALTRVQKGHLLSAIGSYIANPRGATRDAVAKSTELANRQGRQMVEIRQQIRKPVLRPNVVQRGAEWFQEHGYFIQTITQNVVDTIVWTGAYNQAIANGATDAEAVQQGDAALRQTQMATDPEDVSHWESKGAFVRALFPFQSWFIRWANNQVGTWASAPTAGARMSVVIYGYMLPLVLAQLISDVLRGKLEDEEGDGWLDDVGSMALRSMVSGTLAAVPVVGKPMQAAINTFIDDEVWNDRMPAAPVVSTFERARRSVADVTEGKADARDVQDIVGFFGNLAGVPIGSIASRFVYAYRESVGDVEPTGGWDYARGLLTGR